MTTTRVLLVNLSRLVSELVRGLCTPHRDLQVVGSLDGGAGDWGDAHPDVVVIGTGNGGPELARLIEWQVTAGTDVHLVILDNDGQHAYSCRSLGEISADDLLATIRSDRRWP